MFFKYSNFPHRHQDEQVCRFSLSCANTGAGEGRGNERRNKHNDSAGRNKTTENLKSRHHRCRWIEAKGHHEDRGPEVSSLDGCPCLSLPETHGLMITEDGRVESMILYRAHIHIHMKDRQVVRARKRGGQRGSESQGGQARAAMCRCDKRNVTA